MLDVFVDALIDSLKVFGVVAAVYLILSFVEDRIANRLTLNRKLSPLLGVSLGLVPQCGFSVVATDLYQKRHITVGTLLGVYLATSDEALPIFLANPDKAIMLLPLLGIKFIVGVLVGYSADFLMSRAKREVEKHHEECDHAEEIHVGCCRHEIESDAKTEDASHKKKEFIHRHILHPLIHSLKIFLYVLAVNFVFGTVIYYVGEDKLISFLDTNRFVTPLLSVLVGLIPNCASSVIISDLYITGGIGFGAAVGGLCVNAGIGLTVLFRDRRAWRSNLLILLTLFLISLATGYAVSAIMGFR